MDARQKAAKKTQGKVAENLFQNLKIFDQKHMLVEDFGTKKSKKRMRSMKYNVVNEDNIFGLSEMNAVFKRRATKLKETEIRDRAARKQAKPAPAPQNRVINLLAPKPAKTNNIEL
jgi:hypothetical protein